jgi:hypothetical protein
MSGERWRTSGSFQIGCYAISRCRDRWPQDVQQSCWGELRSDHAVQFVRRSHCVAEIAIVARVRRNRGRTCRHLFGWGASRGLTVTNDREWIDRRCGDQWPDTQQNGVQGDRIDRHPIQASPYPHTHNSQRPALHGNSLSSAMNVGKGNLFPMGPRAANYAAVSSQTQHPLNLTESESRRRGAIRLW